MEDLRETVEVYERFRPLSRGPFFDYHHGGTCGDGKEIVFVPFLGDLFSILG